MKMGLLGNHKNAKGLNRGGQTTRVTIMTVCLMCSLVLIIGLFFHTMVTTSPQGSRGLCCTKGGPWIQGSSFRFWLSGESLGVKKRVHSQLDKRRPSTCLERICTIYHTRPIKNNMFGMGFDHSFGLWFITRWLKPDLMIESGAFKGHSTWVLRQAMPDKPLISITPRHPEKYLKKGPAYVDTNCRYYSGKQFIDFGSMEWKSVMKEYGILDQNKVVVFFDDHQNELRRLKEALKAGFRHLLFEDNYDTGTGDHYSLRQICDQVHIKDGGHSCNEDSDEARMRAKRKQFWEKALDTKELCAPGDVWWGVRGQMRDNFNHSFEMISHEEHFENSKFVESVLDLYWELPPVAGPSLTHQTRYDPARASLPIVTDDQEVLFRKLGLSSLNISV